MEERLPPAVGEFPVLTNAVCLRPGRPLPRTLPRVRFFPVLAELHKMFPPPGRRVSVKRSPPFLPRVLSGSAGFVAPAGGRGIG